MAKKKYFIFYLLNLKSIAHTHSCKEGPEAVVVEDWGQICPKGNPSIHWDLSIPYVEGSHQCRGASGVQDKVEVSPDKHIVLPDVSVPIIQESTPCTQLKIMRAFAPKPVDLYGKGKKGLLVIGIVSGPTTGTDAHAPGLKVLLVKPKIIIKGIGQARPAQFGIDGVGRGCLGLCVKTKGKGNDK
jgi:hypothetical protein